MGVEKLLIIGEGGHAKVIARTALLLGLEPVHIKESDEAEFLKMKHSPDMKIICGVGSIGVQTLRKKVLERYGALQSHFSVVVHPQAYVDASCVLMPGTFVAQGVQIVGGSQIGPHSIINTGAIIDHDADIGEACHISPGATLSGGVKCGSFVHIGTGANIVQGMSIANDTVIGAGSVVTQSIHEPGGVWVGVPARRI